MRSIYAFLFIFGLVLQVLPACSQSSTRKYAAPLVSDTEAALLARAVKEVAKQQFDKADETYSNLIDSASKPNSRLLALVGRAAIRFQRFRDYDGAARDYTEAIGLARLSKASIRLTISLTINRAACRLKLGDYKGAKADSETVSKLAGNTRLPAIFGLQGDLARLAGENRKAVTFYDQAIALDKQFIFGYIGQAYSLRDMGDITAAKISWARARDLDRRLPTTVPSAADSRTQDLKDLLEGRKLALARQIGIKIHSNAQESARIEKAVANGAATADDYLLRAKYQLERNSNVAAKMDLDEALKRNPNLLEACRLRGYLTYRSGNYAQAYKDYSKVLQASPNELSIILAHGLSSEKIGKFDVALRDFTHATEIFPELSDGWFGKGRVLSEKGEYLLALENMNRSIQLADDDPMAYVCRGKIYQKLMRISLAVSDFKKALILKPDFKEAQTLLESIGK